MIVTQDYGWSQHARRLGHDWPQGMGWAMAQAASAGYGGWEPLLTSPDEARRVGDLAKAHGLAMPSVFLTGVLHDGEAAATVERFRKTAAISASYGCTKAMIYPSALPDRADKSDDDLIRQADQLGVIAQSLQPLGIQLCYHPEEAEMRLAAREFHHMLLGTDPAEVAFCLDADTIWRGAGQSTVALMDIVWLYGHRVTAMHLRQSRGGIWDEILGPGDLDYPAILAALVARGAHPDLIVELALDEQTAITLDPQAAHARSLAFVRERLLPILPTT